MLVLSVIKFPDPILRIKSDPVTDFTNVKMTISNLKTTMLAYMGSGISAVQCGILQQIMLIKHNGEIIPIINPRNVVKSGAVHLGGESCLSFDADFVEMVMRADKVKFSYDDPDGNEKTLELSKMSARIFQHELDHLNSILMVDNHS